MTIYANTFWTTDEKLFTSTLARDTRHIESHLGLASLALEQRRNADAIGHSTRAFKITEDPSTFAYWSPMVAHTNYGLALYYNGQIGPARQQFKKALAARPQSALAN